MSNVCIYIVSSQKECNRSRFRLGVLKSEVVANAVDGRRCEMDGMKWVSKLEELTGCKLRWTDEAIYSAIGRDVWLYPSTDTSSEMARRPATATMVFWVGKVIWG